MNYKTVYQRAYRRGYKKGFEAGKRTINAAAWFMPMMASSILHKKIAKRLRL